MIVGKYTVMSRNTLTGEETVKHEQENLITDYGLNYFAEGSRTKTANASWELKDCGVWLKEFPEPSVLLEELPLKYLTGLLDSDIRTHFVYNHNTTPTSAYSDVKYDDGEVCYTEATLTYTFNQGAIVGDMHGVYLGCVDAYGPNGYINYNDGRMYPWLYNKNSGGATYIYDHAFSIFSAIKFKDAEGLNTVIPVVPVEQIFIKYTLRRYLPKYVPPRKFNFTTEAGTSHVCTIEPRYWDANYNGSYYDNYNYGDGTKRSAFSKFRTHNSETSQAVGIYTTDSSGTTATNGTGNISITTKGYTNYSYKQDVTYYLNIHYYNKPIKFIDFYNTMGSVRATFEPPLPKDNTLATTFDLGWGWGREEDLVTNFERVTVVNKDFETNLTGWTLEESSPLIHYVQSTVPSVSLRAKNKQAKISQVLDVSQTIIENRRVTCKFKLEGVSASLANITFTYLTTEDVVLATDVVNTSTTAITNIKTPQYIQRNVPVEAITAQKIKVTLNLSTNNSDSSYISVAGIDVLLNNVTAISG